MNYTQKERTSNRGLSEIVSARAGSLSMPSGREQK